ncbi:MAG: HAMP domain-containing protein [Clostridia bacterium]|nr:HAMP domain-containing protein [Clostridia bacterium]
MKRRSITFRLTFWYAVFMSLAVGFSWLSFIRAETEIADRYFINTLEDTSTLAEDEIFMTDSGLDFDNGLTELDGASVSFFDLNGDLIYGNTAIDMPFSDNEHRSYEDKNGKEWRVYDRIIFVEGYGNIYLRTYADATYASSLSTGLSDAFHLILPAAVFLAVIGGIILAIHALTPIKTITRLAEDIADAGDLKKRLPLPKAHDELYKLSGVFNGMLERLDAAFIREARFTSDASHELRTPVAAVLLESETALDEAAGLQEKTNALISIRKHALVMKQMIHQLLMLSRMDAGRVKLEKEETDIKSLLEAVFAEAEEKYSGKRIEGRLQLCEHTVICDQAMITRLFMNLSDNAFKYANNSGFVSIESQKEASGIRISIENTGSGIPQEALNHLFERFYRQDQSRSSEGFGLGLSIAESIVRLHGGWIKAESDASSYTRFTVFLPEKN